MPQGTCKNCGRLIFDTEKLDELPDEIICQHCHTVNIVRTGHKFTCKKCGAGFDSFSEVGTHHRAVHRR